MTSESQSTTKKKRANAAKLAPGTTSIERANPRKQPDGTWWLDWRVCLHDGRVLQRRSKGSTKGEARRRANNTAAEMLKTGANGSWRTTDPLAKYIEQESKKAMRQASLKPLTRERYALATKWLLGDCQQHKHRHSLKTHSIATGIKYSALQDCLHEIASLHGRETARQARTVLSRYVITKLVRDEMITGNPLTGASLDELTGQKATERTRGGKALTRDQHEAVLTYLLALNPAEGTDSIGRPLRPTSVARRRNAIDLLLLQAVTGLRGREATGLLWSDVHVDDDNVMSLDVRKDVAKGSVPRVVLVLDDRVARRMLERRNAANGKGYVIGAPANPLSRWDVRNKDKASEKIYLELAENLDLEVMTTERGHMWRTSLRSIYQGRVPEAVLNSQFGHGERTAQKHYTDPSDLSALAKEAKTEARLRAV